MNRSQLINELATKTNLNKRDITTILDAFTEMVAEKQRQATVFSFPVSVHSNHVCKQAVRQETPETGM